MGSVETECRKKIGPRVLVYARHTRCSKKFFVDLCVKSLRIEPSNIVIIKQKL